MLWRGPFLGPILATAAVASVLAAGCRAAVQDNTPPQPAEAITGENGLPRPRQVIIAFLGDSITAGYGLTSLQAYPAKIEELFHAEGYGDVEVLNSGVTGDTTAGGRQRVEQLFTPETRIVVVALGGNDALRGLSTTQTQDNLTAIIDVVRAHGLSVMLVGMEAPPNYGQDYQANFRAIFTQLVRTYGRQITYVPFLLEGVAGLPALNQADGIHPTADGQKIIAQHLYPLLRDMVDQIPQPAQ